MSRNRIQALVLAVALALGVVSVSGVRVQTSAAAEHVLADDTPWGRPIG
ncbi:hypothetical protein PSH03_003850 [Micromonospora sp. PSH03]|nr:MULTISPECIES: hypothetical protein [Micromonospora]MBQ0988765.1 hypothetical protein [Micromonospora sp. H61]MCG5454686.1 hypothetical protein [Micromonospora salmantinae]